MLPCAVESRSREVEARSPAMEASGGAVTCDEQGAQGGLGSQQVSEYVSAWVCEYVST